MRGMYLPPIQSIGVYSFTAEQLVKHDAAISRQAGEAIAAARARIDWAVVLLDDWIDGGELVAWAMAVREVLVGPDGAHPAARAAYDAARVARSHGTEHDND